MDNRFKVGVAVIFAVVALGFFIVMSAKSPAPLVKEYDLSGEPITITIRFMSPREINREFEKRYDRDAYTQIEGFAILYPAMDEDEDNECLVFAIEPRHQRDYAAKQLLGHEILHCVYGRWHPGNEQLQNF